MTALCGAVIVLVLVCAGSALAAGTQVTVRVEGKSRTLLAGRTVETQYGSITKAGAPPGSCPATSAAGALGIATHGGWGAVYSASLGELELTSILGETWSFAQTKEYWSVWVDNRYAANGICEIRLRRGDRLLFAAVPDKGTVHPAGLTGPRRATKGQPFALKVVYYTDKGVAKPLAGARVRGRGVNAVSNRQGVVSVTAHSKGTPTYTASKSGYIRSPRVTVRVS